LRSGRLSPGTSHERRGGDGSAARTKRPADRAEVKAIGPEIGGIGDAFTNLGNLKNAELDSAFDKDASCQKMQTIFSS
jgi:hypothetical protein